MNTANFISGLLNAAGLKERLVEHGGKAKLHLPEFPANDLPKTASEPASNTSSGQTDDLTDGWDIEIVPVGHEVDPDAAQAGEKTADIFDVGAGALPLDSIEPEEPEAAGSFVVENKMVEDASDVASGTHTETLQSSAPEDEAAFQAAPVAAEVPMEQQAAQIVMPAHASVAGSPAGAGETGFAKAASAEVPPLHASLNAAHTGIDVRSRPVKSADAGSMQRASSTSEFRPLVSVTEFRMSAGRADYPQNFSAKLSNQLDMLRPAFQSVTGREGSIRAGEAGGQTAALSFANAVTATVPQAQQSVQTALISLARENTSTTPLARTMELSLVPRSLGEIKVHMVRSASRIDVEIITNSASATQAMETAKADIVKGYLLIGIQPEEVNIRITESREAVHTALAPGSEQDRNGQGPARNGPGSTMSEQPSHGRQEREPASRDDSDDPHESTGSERRPDGGVMGKVQYF